MPDSLLSYKFEEAKKTTALTGLAGLPVFMDFMHALSFDKVLRQELDTEVSAKCLWKDSTIAICLVLLNLAGGACVDDPKNRWKAQLESW